MKSVKTLLAAVLLASSAFALAAGEFGDHCAFGLSMGKQVKTDCSINENIEGKTYCFSNDQAKANFMKDAKGMLAKAQDNWAKMAK